MNNETGLKLKLSENKFIKLNKGNNNIYYNDIFPISIDDEDNYLLFSIYFQKFPAVILRTFSKFPLILRRPYTDIRLINDSLITITDVKGACLIPLNNTEINNIYFKDYKIKKDITKKYQKNENLELLNKIIDYYDKNKKLKENNNINNNNHNNKDNIKEDEEISTGIEKLNKENTTPENKSKNKSFITKKRGRKISSNSNFIIKKCSICLEPISHIAKLDKCEHEFCKNCIAHWSKLSSECPLCKKNYTNIIYYDGRKHRNTEKKVRKKKFKAEKEKTESWYYNCDEVCLICGKNNNTSYLLICDKCNFRICHTFCVGLDSIPDGEFICPECKQLMNINNNINNNSNIDNINEINNKKMKKKGKMFKKYKFKI